MSRLVAVAALFLLTSATATAQVLDDDLEFENHVATIELDEDSPVLEGVGLSREIDYEAHFGLTSATQAGGSRGRCHPFLVLRRVRKTSRPLRLFLSRPVTNQA